MNISVPVAYLIEAVAQAVQQVRADTGAVLRVSGIKLALETTSELASDGSLSLGPLTIGGVYTQSQTQGLTLQFDEHPTGLKRLTAVQIDPDQLRSLTVAVQVAIQEGAVRLKDYALTQAELAFNFGVTAGGSVALGLADKDKSRGVEFKLAGSQKTTHSLTLTLETGEPKARSSRTAPKTRAPRSASR